VVQSVPILYAACYAAVATWVEQRYLAGEPQQEVYIQFVGPCAAYAASASGENRWRKPQPAPRIERVLNCTKPGERNLQIAYGKTVGAEGRLTLNICRRNSPDRGLPVMVYFHGGNFQTGQPEEWLGNKFSESLNVVHVSVA
jgi:para-nitrobenzyl esterase